MHIQHRDCLYNSHAKTTLCIFDEDLRSQGYSSIAGCDEAGRGPWAGPVVAAAAIMPSDIYIPRINDSKKLTSRMREQLYDHIIASCIDYGIGIVGHETIDTINILRATFQAFQIAFHALHTTVNLLLVDGSLRIPNISISQRCVCRGDALSYSIACASILAKVTRDRLMIDLDKQYPGWGFAKHKGYGTEEHLNTLTRLGLSPIHRKSFNPMKKMLVYA